MSHRTSKTLGENHKRALKSTLTLFDKGLCEIEQFALGRELHSVFYHEQNKLTSTQRKQLLEHVNKAREILAAIMKKYRLNRSVENVSRKIFGNSAGFWEAIVELESKHLARYGELPEEIGKELDPLIRILIKHLDAISDVSCGRVVQK